MVLTDVVQNEFMSPSIAGPQDCHLADVHMRTSYEAVEASHDNNPLHIQNSGILWPVSSTDLSMIAWFPHTDFETQTDTRYSWAAPRDSLEEGQTHSPTGNIALCLPSMSDANHWALPEPEWEVPAALSEAWDVDLSGRGSSQQPESSPSGWRAPAQTSSSDESSVEQQSTTSMSILPALDRGGAREQGNGNAIILDRNCGRRSGRTRYVDGQRSSKDALLVECRLKGMSYREIQALGNFREDISTLRGRYRNLTKRKECRVRKPQWEANDVSHRRRGLCVFCC